MKRRLLSGALAAALFGAGCATGTPAGARGQTLTASWRSFGRPAPPRAIPPPPPAAVAAAAPAQTDLQARERAVRLARNLVGKSRIVVDGRRYPNDCTGLIAAVLDHVGMEALEHARPGDNAVTAIYRYAQRHGRIFEGGHPLPGDLVFFRQTYDQNRDGRTNDGLTHIGIVDDVEADGTVVVIHRVSRGVVRYRMNLANPDVRKDPASGRVLNDYLRNSGPGRRELLTGQLFAAFATVLPSPVTNVAQR